MPITILQDPPALTVEKELSAMYLQNKYSQCYCNIIANAQSRTFIPKVVEKHHILPKSLGGTNDKANLVELTPKEHYICHLLLTKFTVGKNKIKMIYAAFLMCNTKTNKNTKRDYKVTSRMYETLKKQRTDYLKTQKGSLHHNFGRKTGRTSENFTSEWKTKISDAMMGKQPWNKGIARTDDEKEKISITRKKNMGTPGYNIRPACSQATAIRIKEANTGKKWVHNPTNPVERKQLNPEDCLFYIDIGWHYGFGKRVPK